jgi:hypothetical protein
MTAVITFYLHAKKQSFRDGIETLLIFLCFERQRRHLQCEQIRVQQAIRALRLQSLLRAVMDLGSSI